MRPGFPPVIALTGEKIFPDKKGFFGKDTEYKCTKGMLFILIRGINMHRDIKLIILMIMNFAYTVSLVGVVFFYSLMGTVAKDRVNIIITEATGLQRQETMLTANLMPVVLQNLFWLSLAGATFCLICIFFMRHTFHSFWAPATLSIITFFMMLSSRSAIYSFLPDEAEGAAVQYMMNVLERALQANIMVFIFGLLLFYIAYQGDKYFLKKS